MVLQISTAQEHADVHIVDNSVDNQNAPPLHVVVELREISMTLVHPVGPVDGRQRWSWWGGREAPSVEVEERKRALAIQ